MNVWIMCADSESGDHYHCCGSWDHEPSQEEINQIRVELDSHEFDNENDSEDDEFLIVLNGKKYISCIQNYEVFNIEI